MRILFFLFHNALFCKQNLVMVFSQTNIIFCLLYIADKKYCNCRKKKTYSLQIIYWHYRFRNIALM